jgi:hypothetical protein
VPQEPPNDPVPGDLLLGQILLARNFISPEQLRETLGELAREASPGDPEALGRVLVRRGFITPPQLETALRLLKQGPDAAPSVTSHRLGKFQIIRELGRGGMGIVFEALDTTLERRVALKLMLPHPAADPAELRQEEDRFLREARLGANLPKHPHLVGVFEAGVLEGKRFISMQLINGRPMGAWETAAKPALEDRVRLLRSVALAVHHAHDHGIIHRDLKPQNVLVDAKGQPHLTDLGLSKKSGDIASASLSASGAVIGTPAYMSPEQARGSKNVDHRTDIYSLGVMLYQALAGSAPFDGKSPVEILMKVIGEEPPPPSALARDRRGPAVDRALEGVCMKAMARRAADRYETAQALADDLGRWLAGEKVSAAGVARTTGRVPTRRAPPRSRRTVAAAVAAGIAIACLGAFLLTGAPVPSPAQKAAPVLERARQAARQGDARAALGLYDLALTLDPENAEAKEGKLSAKASIEKGDADLKRQIADSQRAAEQARQKLNDPAVPPAEVPKPSPPPPAPTDPKPAPPAVPLPPRTIGTVTLPHRTISGYNPTPVPAYVSTDGKLAVFSQEDRTLRVRSTGSGLTLRELRGHEAAVGAVAISPDSKWVAAMASDGRIMAWDLAADRPPVTMDGRSSAAGPLAFAPESTQLVSGGTDGSVRVWRVGQARQERALDIHSKPVSALAFAAAGALLLSADETGSVKVTDTRAWKTAQRIDAHGGPVQAVAAGAGETFATGGPDGIVKLWNARSGQEMGKLEGVRAPVQSLAFGRDGKRLAVGTADGAIVLWGLSGGAPPFALAAHGGGVTSLAFSADGRELHSSGADGTMRTWSVEEADRLKAVSPPARTLQPGLSAAYYETESFGRLLLRRTDPDIYFQWGDNAPWPEGPRDGFSVLWSGFLKVPKTGTYAFQAKCDDGVNLILDGVLPLSKWENRLPAELTAACALEAGLHRIEVQYREWGGPALMQLSWREASEPAFRRLGTDALFHVADTPALHAPSTEPAAAADGTLRWEAEHLSEGSRCRDGFTLKPVIGGGARVGGFAKGDWLRFTATATGRYEPVVGYSRTGPTPGVAVLEVDGVSAGAIGLPPSGAGTSVGRPILLPPGPHRFRLVLSEPADIDYVSLVPRPLPSAPDAVGENAARKRMIASVPETASGRSGEPRTLVNALLRKAFETRDDPPLRFVLLREARDVAARAGDLAGLLAATEETIASFPVNAAALRTQSLAEVARTFRWPEEWKALAEAALEFADASARDGEFEAAKTFAGRAESAARSAKTAPTTARAQARHKEFEELQKEQKRAAAAEAALAAKPDEPEASLATGRYQCFVREDWEGGLPRIARGPDKALRAAAEKELSQAPALEIADAWWALAEKERTALDRKFLQDRARTWYERAWLEADGLARVRAERRLETLPPRPVDLLQAVAPEADSVQGAWGLDGARILSPAAPASSRLQFPFEPPDEYDLSLRIERVAGSGALSIGLLSQGRPFQLVLDAEKGSGLQLVDGKRADANETAVKDRLLTNHRPVTVACSVRSSGVTIAVDGRRVIAWTGEATRLSLPPEARAGYPRALWLATGQNTRCRLHQAVLLPVSKPLRPLR